MDPLHFRQALGHFPSGVTIVTATGRDGEPHGMTCSAFCSVSAAHPSILVSLTSTTRTAKLLQESGIFAVHILADSQADLANRFAGRSPAHSANRFNELDWSFGVSGAPVLGGALAVLECKLAHAFPASDHLLCVGAVTHVQVAENRLPLLYCQGVFHAVGAPLPTATI